MLRIKMPDSPSGPAPMPEAMDVAPMEEAIEEPIEEAADDVDMAPSGSVDPMVARYFGPEAMCSGCIHFLEPDACAIVAGPIDPAGICSLHTPDEAPVEEPIATDVEV